MALTERLAIIVDAKTGGAVREFKKVSKSAEDLGDTTTRTGKALDKMGLSGKVSAAAVRTGIAAAGAAAIPVLWQMSEAAIAASSALSEQMAAASITFGDASGRMQKFAEDAAESFGLSKRATLEAANSLGVYFANIGISEQSAAAMSEGLVSLAADLASFRDLAGGAEEALVRMRSGLAGEVEPMRRLGVDMSAAAVEAKAMELGLGDAHGELSEGEKVFARYQILLSATEKSQGDFARTSDSLANQQRIANAQLENTSAQLGKINAQFKAGIVTGLNDMLSGISGLAGEDDSAGFMERYARSVGEAGFSWKNLLGPLAQGKNFLDAWNGTATSASDTQQKFNEAMERYQSLQADGNATSKELADALDDVKSASAAVRKEQEPLADAIFGTAKAAEKQKVTLRGLTDAIFDVKQAQFGVKDATNGVRDAESDLVEKRQALAELLSKSVVDERAVADARRDVADATRGVESAERRRVDAQKRLNELLNPSGTNREDRDVRRLRTLQEITKAENRLSQVREAGGSPLAIRDAEIELRDARLDLAKIDEETAGQADEIAEARLALRDAEEDLKRAKEDAKRAGDDLRKAEAGDPDRSKDIAKARQDIETAERNLERAKWAQVTATIALKDATNQEAAALDTLGNKANIAMQNVVNFLKSLGIDPSVIGGAIVAPAPSKKFQARALGGPVDAGQPYLVGERGPELFVPRSAGQIINNAQTTWALSGVTVQASDPAALIREVEAQMRLANLVGR